jgi:multidrug efflux system membrane fusion protein
MEQHNPPLELPPGSPPPPELAAGPQRSRHGCIWIILILAILIIAGVFFWRRHETAVTANKKQGPPPATPVVVVKAEKGDIGVYFTGLGAVTPINTVAVKSRVDGQLMRVLYKEGDLVQEGALLVEIDPRPFQVQLTQAEGQLLKDEASLENARVDLTRYETLVAQKAAPEQQLATQRALVKQDEGIVKTDEGTVDNAKLNITYSRIDAPISGRIGLRLVDPGNMVHSSDTNGLLVITQVQPISAIFTIAEDQLPQVVQKLHAGQRLPVDAYDREAKNKIAQGQLTTVDNQIDPGTGTLRLRAVFPNTNNALFPNQFVNARLLVQEKKGVTLLQTAAVQRNAQSTYVYVVKQDSTLELRPIVLGTTEGDQSEITSGLKPGEVVVMTGVDKLQEGSRVTPHYPGEKPAPDTPPGKPAGGGAKKGKGSK